MKVKKFYVYLMMLVTSMCVISCSDDDSIAPIERGEKVLAKMEIKPKNEPYSDFVTYSYDNNGDISKIDIVRKHEGSSQTQSVSYIIEGNTLISTEASNVENKLNDAKYIVDLFAQELDGSHRKFTYHSSGYLKASIIVGGNNEKATFEPIYDKQWRMTSSGLQDNSIECIWSDIPNKGNLFFWNTIDPGLQYFPYVDNWVIALANAGLFGKAQAFLPKKYGDENEEYSLDRNILKYELDGDGYVIKATMSDGGRGPGSAVSEIIYTFTYE